MTEQTPAISAFDISGRRALVTGGTSGIGAAIAEIDQISGGIAAAMEEQSAATREISRSVAETSVAAQEVSARIADVSHEASETGRQAVQVKAGMGEVAHATADLRAALVAHGLETIRARHTCAHRVDELLAVVDQLTSSKKDAA